MATSMDDAARMAHLDISEGIAARFRAEQDLLARLNAADPWKRRHRIVRRRFLWWRWSKVVYLETEERYAERLVKLGPRPRTFTFPKSNS